MHAKYRLNEDLSSKPSERACTSTGGWRLSTTSWRLRPNREYTLHLAAKGVLRGTAAVDAIVHESVVLCFVLLGGKSDDAQPLWQLDMYPSPGPCESPPCDVSCSRGLSIPLSLSLFLFVLLLCVTAWTGQTLGLDDFSSGPKCSNPVLNPRTKHTLGICLYL